jgi:hypothetical protein
MIADFYTLMMEAINSFETLVLTRVNGVTSQKTAFFTDYLQFVCKVLNIYIYDKYIKREKYMSETCSRKGDDMSHFLSIYGTWDGKTRDF